MNLTTILRKEENGEPITQAEENFLDYGIAGKPTTKIAPAEFTDSDSGLGIGGIGSDDYNINTEALAPSRYEHKCGRGQRYDERCSGCGRVTVICNDCELCSRCHEKGL